MFFQIYRYDYNEKGYQLSIRDCRTNWFEIKDNSFQACGEESFQFPFGNEGDEKLYFFLNVKNHVKIDRGNPLDI